MLATHQLTWTVGGVLVAYSILLAVALTIMWRIRPRGTDDDRVAVVALERVGAADQPDAAGNQNLQATRAADDPAVLIRADELDARVKGDGH